MHSLPQNGANVREPLERFLASLNEVRAMELAPVVAPAVPAAAADLARASRCGMAAATSMVEICLHELDGAFIDRELAREYARRIVRAYLDQVDRVTQPQQGVAR